MQENRPIAFLRQALKGKALHMSTYEKGLFALVTAIHKWRTYLLGQSFVVGTDQQSLKFQLEQKIGTPFQQGGSPNFLATTLWSSTRKV